MKKTKILLKMVALAVVGAVMSGCAEEVEVLQPANQRVVQKTTISLADDATTRGAIAADGSTSFLVDDQIAVIYQDTNGKTMKAVSAALTDADLTDGGASATFTVELVSPKAGTKVRYIYPSSMAPTTIAEDTAPDAAATVDTDLLDMQDGTIENLAQNLDLSLFDGQMTDEAKLPASAVLSNQLVIIGLQEISDGANDVKGQISKLTVSDGSVTYTIDRTAANSTIYVAMLPVGGKDIQFSTTVNGVHYVKTAKNKTLVQNKIYPINLTMDFDAFNTPLTLEAIEAGAQVTFAFSTTVAANSVEYRTFNGTGWSDWSNDYTSKQAVTLTNIGDKVQFKGTNSTYATDYSYSKIYFDKDCYVYGNIMSLIDAEGFSTSTPEMGDKAFQYLFSNNPEDSPHLKWDVLRPFLLPATTLSQECYYGMFDGCTGLTFLPADLLPATTLTQGCYNYMFARCSGLSALPEDLLPATTLTQDCYNRMFAGCSGLSAIPAGLLPATTLAKCCYMGMFWGCSGLSAIPAGLLPVETLAEFCYDEMFKGCSGLSALPADLLPATTLAQNCYNSMFYGCSSLTTLPEGLLPATTLDYNCYDAMFWGCSGLTTVPTDLLPARMLTSSCYENMFRDCSSLTNAPELPAPTPYSACYKKMFNGCSKLSSLTCLATTLDIRVAGIDCLNEWLTGTGTEDGCERIVYVDPSMLTVGTSDSDGQWYLNSSGDGNTKKWTLADGLPGRYPRALADAEIIDLGRLVGADGKIYATASQITTAGTTAIGVIAYLDDATTTADDEITEKSNGFGHGLVLCLKNAASGKIWSTELDAYEFGEDAKVDDTPALKRLTNVSGYTNTKTLADKTDAATKYPAAYQAKNYTGLTAPAGTTGWFLPSAQQWVRMQTGLGGLPESDIEWHSWYDTPQMHLNKLEVTISNAGAGNYDSLTSDCYWYWSSSEYSNEDAVFLTIKDANVVDSGFIWYLATKTQSYTATRVRPVLAF